MPSPVERFWDQYQANVDYARRNRKYKFARLFWALLLTIVIAPICYGIRDFTGSGAAAAVFGVFAALFGVLVWWVIESIWRSSAARHETLAAEVVPAQPVMPAAPFPAAPNWPATAAPPAPPKPSSSSGPLVVLGAVFAVLALSCCGGGIALVALGTRLTTQPAVAPNQGPGNPGFGPPGFPAGPDPLGDMHRQHQKQMEEMRRKQEEMFRDLERRRPGISP